MPSCHGFARTWTSVDSTCVTAPSIIQFGMPQGSVLGLLLFMMYTANVVNIVEQQGLSLH